MKIEKKIYIKLKCLLSGFAVVAATAVTGCQSESSGGNPVDPESGIIHFGAVIRHEATLNTRVGHEADAIPEVESMNSAPYNMDFYIEVCCDGVADDGSVPNPGTYVIPSGFSGWLQAKNTKERLKWRNLTSDHTFYGWNLPWSEDSYDQLLEADENQNITGAEMQPRRPLKIHFHDSPEDQKGDKGGYHEYVNDSIYQYFVGVKRTDVNYPQNGQYVELEFKHLVSKVIIEKLSMIEGPHTIQNNLKANMTIYGMPKSATFYPHPGADIPDPVGDGYPIVVADKIEVETDETGVTYFIPNDPNGKIQNVFYICPEVDFKDLVFEIKINDEKYSQYGSYWGNFNNVEFKRTHGVNYDQGNGKDDTILHAGEEMHLVIELYQGMGPGIAIVIDPWSTEKPNDAVHHSHQGIYTDSEASDIIGIFSDSNPDQDAIDNLLGLYGEKTDDDGGVFYLYENISVNGSSFPLGKYVLNGLGHTITMKSSPVTIGMMRDVYLTDGTNTVYIDDSGKVYLWNPESYEYDKYVASLSGDKTTINLKTGTVS